jgi:hypothetical protein
MRSSLPHVLEVFNAQVFPALGVAELFLYILCSLCDKGWSLLKWFGLNCHHTAQVITEIVGEAMNLSQKKS